MHNQQSAQHSAQTLHKHTLVAVVFFVLFQLLWYFRVRLGVESHFVDLESELNWNQIKLTCYCYSSFPFGWCWLRGVLIFDAVVFGCIYWKPYLIYLEHFKFVESNWIKSIFHIFSSSAIHYLWRWWWWWWLWLQLIPYHFLLELGKTAESGTLCPICFPFRFEHQLLKSATYLYTLRFNWWFRNVFPFMSIYNFRISPS